MVGKTKQMFCEVGLKNIQDEKMSRKVLVFNKNYLPINVYNINKAFSKIFANKAEIVHIENGVYQSFDFKSWVEFSKDKEGVYVGNHKVIIPKVVRMIHTDSVYQKKIRLSLKNLAIRDGYKCEYCWGHTEIEHATFDHVVPKSKGGKLNWANVVYCCKKCNERKGNKTIEELGIKLTKKPVKPQFDAEKFYSIRLGDT